MEAGGEGGASLQRFRGSSPVAGLKVAAEKEIWQIQGVKLWNLKVAAHRSLTKVHAL